MKKTTASTKKNTTKKTHSLTAFQTGNDLRNAALVVSLLFNLVVVCLWITLQITSEYDAALADFFINR